MRRGAVVTLLILQLFPVSAAFGVTAVGAITSGGGRGQSATVRCEIAVIGQAAVGGGVSGSGARGNAGLVPLITPAGFVPVVSNPVFLSSAGWIKQAEEVGASTAVHNSTEASLDMLVQNNTAKGRFAGWIELNAADDAANAHLKYADAGPGKIVRAKFGIYARRLDGSTPAVTEIPNFNVRVNDRFGFCNNLFVQHNLPANDNARTIADDLAPSTDPNNPSIYRIDMDPPELPYYSTAAGANEGLQRYVQAFVAKGEAQFGRLSLAESVIGIYDAPDLSAPSALIKEYKANADFNATRVQWQLRKLTRGTLVDTHQAIMTGISSTTPVNPVPGFSAINQSELSVNLNPGGVPGAQLFTSGVPDSQIGIAALDWLTGAAEDDSNALRARIEENKLYAIRFHASATGDSSNNAMIRFRARTVKFSWTHRLEVGGAWNLFQQTSGHTRANQAARATHVVARQYLPGNGGLAGSTAAPGAAYDLLMLSPLMPDLRADIPGTLVQKFPQLASQPGPGDTTTTLSRRDIFPAVDLMDTLSGDYFIAGSTDAGEKGNVHLHKIEIRRFDAVTD